MKRILLALFLASSVAAPVAAIVTTTTNSAPYTGNGFTTSYPVPFKVLKATDLEVKVNGVLKLMVTDYTVTLRTNSATVVFAAAPAAAAAITINRIRGFVQEQSFRQQGPLNMATLEDTFDSLEMQIQQLVNQVFSSGAFAVFADSPIVGTGVTSDHLRWNFGVANTWTALQTFNPTSATDSAIVAVGGTGVAIEAYGGNPNGRAIQAFGTGLGEGIYATGGGAGTAAVRGTGSVGAASGGWFVGGPDGVGVLATGGGGTTSAAGVTATGGPPNGNGVNGFATGTGYGVKGISSATVGSVALWGEALGTTTYAGWFNGTVNIDATGSISTNLNAFTTLGKGSGWGGVVVGGATGGGLWASGVGTGEGVKASGGGATGVSTFCATASRGGCFVGGGTAEGLAGKGGATNGTGLIGTGGSTNGTGVTGLGTGSGIGVTGTGGGTAGAAGVMGTGGSGGGDGIQGFGNGAGRTGVVGIAGSGGSGIVGTTSGNGVGVTGSGSGNGTGVQGSGGATGVGIYGFGVGTSGVGVRGDGMAGNSAGVQGLGNGSGVGGVFAGGTSGDGATLTSGGSDGHGVSISVGNTHRSHISMNLLTNDPDTLANGDLWIMGSGAGTMVKARMNGATAIIGGNAIAMARSSAGATLNNTTQTTIVYGTEEVDSDSAYDNATGIFTVPTGKGGYYNVSCSIAFALALTANNVQVDIFVNGATAQRQGHRTNPAAEDTISVSAMVAATAGQTIDCRGYQDAGSGKAYSTTAARMFITIKRIGD